MAGREHRVLSHPAGVARPSNRRPLCRRPLCGSQKCHLYSQVSMECVNVGLHRKTYEHRYPPTLRYTDTNQPDHAVRRDTRSHVRLHTEDPAVKASASAAQESPPFFLIVIHANPPLARAPCPAPHYNHPPHPPRPRRRRLRTLLLILPKQLQSTGQWLPGAWRRWRQ
jgi:hypothetical protein